MNHMSTAKVKVLHDILTANGWLTTGAEVSMDAIEARNLESTGKVDVLEVDGKHEVWSACCDGAHDHN